MSFLSNKVLVGVHLEFQIKYSKNCLFIKSLFLVFFRYISKSLASFSVSNDLTKINFHGPRFLVETFKPLLWPSNLLSRSEVDP